MCEGYKREGGRAAKGTRRRRLPLPTTTQNIPTCISARGAARESTTTTPPALPPSPLPPSRLGKTPKAKPTVLRHSPTRAPAVQKNCLIVAAEHA